MNLGCGSDTIDLIVDEPDPLPLVQDVIEVLISGVLDHYAPAVDGDDQPIYLQQEAA